MTESRSTPPWWAGLAPALATVDCGGATHRVRWSQGALHLDDHDDADAEEALVALGGDPPACFALVALWRAYATEPQLVTLGRRPGEETVGLDAPSGAGGAVSLTVPGAASRGMAAALERMRAVHQRRADLLRLLSLPTPMIDRLVLSVLAACAERWDDDDFREEHGLRLGAALSVRATPALRRLARRLAGPDCDPDVGVSPLWPGRATPLVAARVETPRPVVTAELPLSWLVDVWGRGISEPGDEFVLAVRDGRDDGKEFDVFVAEWELAGPSTWEAAPVPATVTIGDDGVRRVRRRW